MALRLIKCTFWSLGVFQVKIAVGKEDSQKTSSISNYNLRKHGSQTTLS